MSTRKDHKIDIYQFGDVWERVSKVTDIKKQAELAEVVGVKQNTVSTRKSQNVWPEEWAYRIGKRYGFLTEWLLTGEGPMRLDDLQGPQAYKFPILKNLDQWLTELVVNEPYRRDWFKGNLEDAFPMFKAWMKRREERESKNADFPDKDIA